MDLQALSWDAEFPAPAKINLFLHVTGRRADGYHLLQTAFRFLDRADGLRFSPRDDGAIVRATELAGVPEEADLCLRAARLLRAAAGPAFADRGVTITLAKRLPMGGGLGGGSSDAATVLMALNHLWGIHFSREKLQALGLQLGADVPVFLFGRAAFAQGVGEELAAIEMPSAWYVVVEPGVAIGTAEIFGAPELTRDTKVIKMPDFSAGPALEISGLSNDLQPVACTRFPVVRDALDQLSKVGLGGRARMSGSGACVFAEFADEAQARAAAQVMCAAGWVAWAAKGLDLHPLFVA